MKKIIFLSIAFVLAVGVILPVFADDTSTSTPSTTATSTDAVASTTPSTIDTQATSTASTATSTESAATATTPVLPSKSADNNGIKANAGDKLEKIPSPDLIRYYKNIVKQGASLYGIRKDEMIAKKEAKASSTEQKLEKIPAPKDISLFERIKKIGTALWGYRKAKPAPARRIVPADMSACVITAVETKDTMLVAKNNAFTADLNTAIEARTACQKIALGSVENQIANIDACNKTFAVSTLAMKVQNQKDHDLVWKTYRASLTACAKNETSASSTTASEGDIVVPDGGGSIVDVASGGQQ